MTYAQLQAELTRLQTEASQLKAQGEYLTDARIDSSKPGGSARGAVAKQYRLRMKGKASRYLKEGEVAEIRAAIARGQQLAKVEREINKVVAKIDEIAAQARKLGLELPEQNTLLPPKRRSSSSAKSVEATPSKVIRVGTKVTVPAGYQAVVKEKQGDRAIIRYDSTGLIDDMPLRLLTTV